MKRNGFTTEDARSVGLELGIDWDTSPFDVEQFHAGMEVELEHGARARHERHRRRRARDRQDRARPPP